MDKKPINPFELPPGTAEKNTKIKHLFYNWDQEQEVIREMQKCQRNWDYSKEVPLEIIDYLLWHCSNSPSKQWEAYYDVFWTADRKVIKEISKYLSLIHI